MDKINEKTILMNINDISKIFRDQMRKESDRAGFLHAYRPILFQLKCKNGLTQAELAENTMLKAPTISLTLQKMEYAGLITRIQDSVDLRITHVYITEEGLKACDKLHQLAVDFEKRILSHLSNDDLEKGNEIINKILNAIMEEVKKSENI